MPAADPEALRNSLVFIQEELSHMLGGAYISPASLPKVLTPASRDVNFNANWGSAGQAGGWRAL